MEARAEEPENANEGKDEVEESEEEEEEERKHPSQLPSLQQVYNSQLFVCLCFGGRGAKDGKKHPSPKNVENRVKGNGVNKISHGLKFGFGQGICFFSRRVPHGMRA